jgi:hypothetical protein
MEITVAGDQLILRGPVVVRDYDEIAGTLAAKPQIKIVILRNSPGGDAPTGYHLGELFRQKSLRTAVSGYCYSSCSRLYLGGKERYFTDDYPPQYTQIGFHGHYDRNGDLNAAYVAELHLKDWIIRYSDGKGRPSVGRALDQHPARNRANSFLQSSAGQYRRIFDLYVPGHRARSSADFRLRTHPQDRARPRRRDLDEPGP